MVGFHEDIEIVPLNFDSEGEEVDDPEDFLIHLCEDALA
jgi:hypothetical protein